MIFWAADRRCFLEKVRRSSAHSPLPVRLGPARDAGYPLHPGPQEGILQVVGNVKGPKSDGGGA
jgi:hypothetical protein